MTPEDMYFQIEQEILLYGTIWMCYDFNPELQYLEILDERY